ncbi:MAG: nucleotidyltransferase family protein [Anaerolineales bacterium]|nr:nucleotidyltransferase family protein [Anaerolineales bacterium]
MLDEQGWRLLRAALHDGEAARAAWEAWRQATPLEAVTATAYRVLPTLYYNLRRVGVATPELARLGGVARKAWVEGQVWNTGLADALAALAAADIPAIVRGGPALARYYPAGAQTRHNNDHELLVAPEQATAALAALQTAGWRVPQPPHFPARAWRGPVRCLGAGAQAYVDVAPHLAWEAHGGERDWPAEAQTLTVGRLTARVLAPAAQLLGVCVAGQRGYGDEQARWAADAWWIIRSAGATLDWSALAELAAALGVEPPVAAALEALATELNAPVPAGAPAELRARPVSHRAARFWALNRRLRGRLGELPVLWADYARRVEFGPLAGGWPRFLQAAWNLPHLYQLPGQAARRLWRRAVG